MSKRVRPKTYSIGLYLVIGVGLIQLFCLGSIFFLRHAVKIDLDAPLPSSPIQISEPPMASTPVIPPLSSGTQPNVASVTPTGSSSKSEDASQEVAVPLPTTKPKPNEDSQHLQIVSSNGRLSLKAAMDPHDRILALNREADKYRGENNYDLARAALLEAENLDPNDLLTLQNQAEVAQAMSDPHRAIVYWQRIASLGSDAGNLEEIALQKLKALQAAPPPSTETSFTLKDKVFTTGRIVETVIRDDPQMYEFALRVPIILQNSNTDVQPGDLHVQLFFIDLDSSGDVVPSKAKRTVFFENSTPTWTTSRTETLLANYQLTRSLGGDRSYGYLFRIYYQGKLQDEQAVPTKLLSIYPSVTPSSTTP